MTIWRDLKKLEKMGYIQRVRGGAIKSGLPDGYEPFFESKERIYNEQKKKIAQYAAEHLIAKDEIIILEGGTTVGHMISYLSQPNLTILTNGLSALVRIAHHVPRFNVICCGGMLREKSHTFVGPQAEAFFANFHAHKFFLGATGLNLEDGLTDPNPLEIQIKRAMHKCAEQTIVLLDSSKFGVRSLTQIIPFDEIDALVTDAEAPRSILDGLAAIGIQIHVVEELKRDQSEKKDVQFSERI